MEILSNLRTLRPLIHCITNYVSVCDVANALLAIGASPIMADDESEASQITSISNALLINIGTLNSRTINAMIKAGKTACELGKPVILDPVGVGATDLRNETTQRLLSEVKFSLIRGNISEIKFLAGVGGNVAGVDASASDMNTDVKYACEVATAVARKFNCVVAISGKIDVISDGVRVAMCENGDAMMSSITGTGCMLGAILGAFVACAKAADGKSCDTGEIFDAVCAGVATFGICGENAAMKTRKAGLGTGNFRAFLIDELSLIDDSQIENNKKIKLEI